MNHKYLNYELILAHYDNCQHESSEKVVHWLKNYCTTLF